MPLAIEQCPASWRMANGAMISEAWPACCQKIYLTVSDVAKAEVLDSPLAKIPLLQ